MHPFHNELEKLRNRRNEIVKGLYKIRRKIRANTTLSEDPKLREQQLLLEEEWDEIEKEIDRLTNLDFTDLSTDELESKLRDDWSDLLYWVDFHEPEKTFSSLIYELKKHGTGLVVIQDSAVKVATEYWKRMKFIMHRQNGRNVSYPIPVAFDEFDSLTNYEFLNKLQKHFNLNTDPSKDITEALEKVVDSIFSRAIPKHILPILFTTPMLNEDFLNWFSTSFWKMVVQRAKSYKERRVLCIILIDNKENKLPNCCHDVAEFQPELFFEILLDNWSMEHLEEWFDRGDVIEPMYKYLKFSDEKIGHITPILVNKAHEASGGTPKNICQNLKVSIPEYLVKISKKA